MTSTIPWRHPSGLLVASFLSLAIGGCSEQSENASKDGPPTTKADLASDCQRACANWATCDELDVASCAIECQNWRGGVATCLGDADMSNGWTCDEEVEYCFTWYQPPPQRPPRSVACEEACANWKSCTTEDIDVYTCELSCQGWREEVVDCMKESDMSNGWDCDETSEACLVYAGSR